MLDSVKCLKCLYMIIISSKNCSSQHKGRPNVVPQVSLMGQLLDIEYLFCHQIVRTLKLLSLVFFKGGLVLGY